MQSETQWVLVPREPTEEMYKAAFDNLVPAFDAAAAYSAMIAAAPSPPAGGGEPVAWPDCWRVKAHGNWLYFTDEETAFGSAEMHSTAAQPLYVHPPSPAPAHKRIRRLEDMRASILKLTPRVELLGGQRFKYVKLEDVMLILGGDHE
jgi:hypothetical protein